MQDLLQPFIQVIGVLVVLSAASERLVEVIKGYLPWLGKARVDEKDEARRQSHVIIVAVLVNLCTTALAWPMVKTTPVLVNMDNWYTMVGFAILASGGSSLWNSVLSYLVGLKDIKKSEAKTAKLETQRVEVATASSAPSIRKNLMSTPDAMDLGGGSL